jgi:hypothetical protein
MTTPTGLDLLAINVRFFWRSLDRIHEGTKRHLYVSPHTRAMATWGPPEYLVGTYMRDCPLGYLVEDLEAHLGMNPGALHGPFRLAARAEHSA